MKEITDINEFKHIQIGILNYVDSFCKEHNIKYSLGYGTLIGAVRHKGFIPWDDDIDIIMRRSEYDRFIELFSKVNGRYKVWSHTLQKEFPFAYAKVTDEATLKVEYINHEVERGLDIDVFPFDDIPDNEYLTKKQFSRLKMLHNILSLKQIKYSSRRPLYKNIILTVGRVCFCWYSIDRIVSKLIMNAKRYEGCKGKMCAQMVSYVYKEKEIHPRAYSETYTQLEFEGHFYPVMSGYESYMRQIYGDYMKLPPEDKRVTHHAFKAFWKD